MDTDVRPAAPGVALTPALSSVGAVALGVVVAAVGLGLLVPHARAGSWPTAAGGAVAAAGGVALIVRGAARLWRGHGWPVRAALPLALLAGLYVVGEPVAVAVAVVTTPRAQLAAVGPADRGVAGTEVTFPTSDGVRLAAWYAPPREGAAVVLVPGASSTRTTVLGQAAVLARRGYGVLLLDPRGMGRSGGRAMNIGWCGERDLGGAVDWLAGRPEVAPGRIAVLGESMGGEAAIGAAGADPRVAAVVAEGATQRVAGDREWLSDVYGVRGTVQEGVDALTTALVALLSSAPQPATLGESAAAAAPRPILHIAAGTEPDEANAGRAIVAAAARAAPPGNVTTWVVPGAGHTGGLRARPAQWEEQVVGFLDAALAVGRP